MRSCPNKNVLPVICFWVSVESVSLSSCRAFAIPPQCWTSCLLSWSLNTRFLRAPAAAWFTPGWGLRRRATRKGIPPSWETCDTEMWGERGLKRWHLKGVAMDWLHCKLQAELAAKCDDKWFLSSLSLKVGYTKVFTERSTNCITTTIQSSHKCENKHTQHRMCACLEGVSVRVEKKRLQYICVGVLRPPVWRSPLWRWCAGWRWLHTAGNSLQGETGTLQPSSGSGLTWPSCCSPWSSRHGNGREGWKWDTKLVWCHEFSRQQCRK